jgi:hypothetical protein
MGDRYSEYDDRGERYDGRDERFGRGRSDRDSRRDDRERPFEEARNWARDDDSRRYDRPRERTDDRAGRVSDERRFIDSDRARGEAGGRARWQGGYPDIGAESRETDYSGMSFGRGHRPDARVYPPGAGLEAGYMAPPTPAYWEDHSRERPRPRDVDDRQRDRGRPGDPQAWWQQRPAAGPYVGRGPRGYQRSDERIREELHERLTAHGHVDATDIECQVQNGEVTLTGYVNSRAEKHEAEDVANDIAGVHDVHNRLRIRTHAGEEGVGRTSVLGLTESEAQNRNAARATQAAEPPRTRG